MTDSTRKVIEEIGAERLRQLADEGWSLEHDDEHDGGEMAAAGAFYAAQRYISVYAEVIQFWLKARLWPWRPSDFKPTNDRRDLIKAAALIVAEIERLDRAQEKEDG